MGRFCSPLNPNKHSWNAMVMFRPLHLVAACSLSFVTWSSSTVFARELVDGIVAVVNSGPIMKSEIDEKIQKGPQVLVSPFPAGDDASDHEKALNDKINLQLISDHAKTLELEITDEDVENHLRRIMDEYKIDRPQLVRLVEREGKDFNQYLLDIKNQILLVRFQGRVIMPLVKLTDKDIEAYYLKKYTGNPESVILQLQQIIISLPGDARESVRNAKLSWANDVYQKLVDGMSFDEAQKLHSDQKSGEASSFRLNDLNATIRAAVNPLEKGQFSKPVQIGNNLYIFYLKDKKVAPGSDFEEKKQKIAFELRQKEIKSQLHRWLKMERDKAKIQILN